MNELRPTLNGSATHRRATRQGAKGALTMKSRHDCTCAEFDLDCFLADCSGGKLRHSARLLPFKKDQVIARRGERQEGFMAVSEGMLRFCRSFENGERSILALVYPGEIVAHGIPDADWHADLEAVTDGSLSYLDDDAFQDLRRLKPEVDDYLLAQSQVSLVKAHGQIGRLRQRSAESRVAAFLIELLALRGKQPARDIEIAIPMVRAEIADYLGIKTETVSRAFTRLVARGIITLPRPSRAIVRDRAALADLAVEG